MSQAREISEYRETVTRMKAFSLTHVVYEEGDHLGFMLAFISLSPIFIVVSYATLIASRREMHTICVFIGQLANVVLNAVLKEVIDEPRPEDCERSDKGMPSNHAQFMFFWSTYVALLLLKRFDMGHPLLPGVIAVCGTLLSIMVAVSRVYLMYHTLAQVVVGAIIGTTFGCAWYYAVVQFMVPIFPTIGNWYVSRALYLKDCSFIPNTLRFERESALNLFSAQSEPQDEQRRVTKTRKAKDQ